jgi:hypothetical protein
MNRAAARQGKGRLFLKKVEIFSTESTVPVRDYQRLNYHLPPFDLYAHHLHTKHLFQKHT